MRSTNGYSLLSEGEVIEEERFEALLDVPSCVYLAPWRSLWIAGKLDSVKIPESCTWSVLKWEWEIEEINRVLLNSNIKRLFCTSTGKKCPLPTFSYPDYVADDIVAAENKSGVFFMGWNNNKLRDTIFKDYSDRFSVIMRDSYAANERNKDYRKEFTEALARASFSMCPKGVGSGTRRFWESLRAGAIPVLVSDEFAPPEIWDWNSTIIRVPEKKALYCRNSLYNATIIKDEQNRRAQCLLASKFFSNPANISEYISNVTKQRI